MGTQDIPTIAWAPAEIPLPTASVALTPTATVTTHSLTEQPQSLVSTGLILSGVALFTYGVCQMRRFYRVKQALTRSARSPVNASTPCLSCRFYSHHASVRCVVHPQSVLRPAARRCQDYWKLNSRRFMH